MLCILGNITMIAACRERRHYKIRAKLREAGGKYVLLSILSKMVRARAVFNGSILKPFLKAKD